MKAFKLYWIGVILNLSVYKIHSLTRQRLYVERSDTVSGTNISISTAASETECALDCVENARCRRFGYSRDHKKCYTSRDTLNPIAIGGATFGRRLMNTHNTDAHRLHHQFMNIDEKSDKPQCFGYCPYSKGYEEVSISGRKLCIKIGTKKMNYTDGLQECMSDGAHLFTLEGSSDAAYIENNSNSLWLWIDGAKNLKTWYGEPLPWTEPVNIPPPSVDYCIVLNRQGKNMVEVACHTTGILAPICQIDL